MLIPAFNPQTMTIRGPFTYTPVNGQNCLIAQANDYRIALYVVASNGQPLIIGPHGAQYFSMSPPLFSGHQPHVLTYTSHPGIVGGELYTYVAPPETLTVWEVISRS